MKEIIKNGFIDDLLCKLPLPSKIDPFQLKKGDVEEFPIMQVVRMKLIHPTHVQMGSPLEDKEQFMLALVMYTGGECTYAMRESQRNGPN